MKKKKTHNFVDHMIREKKKRLPPKRGFKGDLKPDEDLAMVDRAKPGRGYGNY